MVEMDTRSRFGVWSPANEYSLTPAEINVPLLPLTIDILKREATTFARVESTYDEPSLFGVTDGKAIGTYIEHKFRAFVVSRYVVQEGNSAKGIDFPELNVDIKVTSERQPQSSCPFKSARQKIFGLGYSLLVFVYSKSDDPSLRTARLSIGSMIFIDAPATADYTMTLRLREMIKDGANQDDIVAYFVDRNLPIDDIEAERLAIEALQSPPEQGYLTISNALQWRLQYGHALRVAGAVAGVHRLATEL
ncbi:MAG: restriction endonuclease [Byssovorax sp.]